MDLGSILYDLIFDYTLRTVALGSATLGLVSGALGSFAVLRRQSLLGDAMSHAALPGIVIAFYLTRSKAPLVLMLGAALAGWLATLLVMQVTSTTRVKYDSALALVLSVFFGIGLVALTFVQRLSDARQAGLETFLFGQAAALLTRDVITMAAIGGLVLLALVLFWKEFKLLSFDPAFGGSLGFPIRALDVGLTTLLVLAIVIGLQAVGVVLMSAMIVAPAAAARQWTDRLGVMVILAAFFGALAGVTGAVASSLTPRLSTGPSIVLSASLIVAISLAFAPHRGLIWGWFRQQHERKRLRMDAVLAGMYTLALQHENRNHPHSEAVLETWVGQDVTSTLKALAEIGWAKQVEEHGWALTEAGWNHAARAAQTQSTDNPWFHVAIPTQSAQEGER